MTKEEIIQAAINRIAKAKFDDAFLFLKPYIKKGSDTQTHLLLIESNYNHARQLYAGNQMDYEDFTRDLSKVCKSFIEACHQLSDEDMILDVRLAEYDLPISEPAKKPIAKRDVHKICLDAKRLRKEGKYAEALAIWEGLPLDKQNRIAFLNELAMLHRLMGNYEKALFVLEGIKNDKRRDVKSLNELATCQRELNRLQSAIETLDLGLTWEPHNNHFHTNLFFIYLFFTQNKTEAKAVQDNYQTQFGKNLIDNEVFRETYDNFITELDDIKIGKSQNNLLERYLQECVNKRSFRTARNLLETLKNLGHSDTWINELQNMLPTLK